MPPRLRQLVGGLGCFSFKHFRKRHKNLQIATRSPQRDASSCFPGAGVGAPAMPRDLGLARVADAARRAELAFAGAPTEVNGGLNNLVMALSQLLHETCDGGRRAVATLVLPRFTSGVNFFQRKYSNESLDFGEVFSVPYFQHRVRPCSVVAHEPAGASVRPLRVVPINKDWPYDHMLPLVYGALRPGRAVRPLVAGALREVGRRAGPRWSAVHLRIERDWFYITAFCNVARYTPRRCFTPAEAAAVTKRSRARANTTGTLLLYAEDLMSPRGPKVDPAAFGAPTIKLPRIANASYTVRAAVEMFVAAEARAGFYGNSYSTFSRGVAMLRSVGCAGCPSFAYDCAALHEKRNFSRLRTVEPHGPHGCSARGAANASHVYRRVRGALGSLEPARPTFGSMLRAMTKGRGLPKRVQMAAGAPRS